MYIQSPFPSFVCLQALTSLFVFCCFSVNKLVHWDVIWWLTYKLCEVSLVVLQVTKMENWHLEDLCSIPGFATDPPLYSLFCTMDEECFVQAKYYHQKLLCTRLGR